MKTCKKCKAEKSEDQFPHRKRYDDGLNVYCKPCWNTMNKQYRQKHSGTDRENIAITICTSTFQKIAKHMQPGETPDTVISRALALLPCTIPKW